LICPRRLRLNRVLNLSSRGILPNHVGWLANRSEM